MFLLLICYILANTCASSTIYCSDVGSGAVWVDGIEGCRYIVNHEFGGGSVNASCEGGRCQYYCGSTPIDLNRGCDAGIPATLVLCATGLDCSTSPWDVCNNEVPVIAGVNLPTLMSGTVPVTFTSQLITWCTGSCVEFCNSDAGQLVDSLPPYSRTCVSCATGVECANADNGGKYCDTFSQHYLPALYANPYPGDPILSPSDVITKTRCVQSCDEIQVSDARAGFYVMVDTTDPGNSLKWTSIPVPVDRFPIAHLGDNLKARPGIDNTVLTCNVCVDNVECSGWPTTQTYSIATQLSFPSSGNCYCVNQCPFFSGGTANSDNGCRQCDGSLANGCQWRMTPDSNTICDMFIKYLPGDPFHTVGFNVCAETCMGAVNGSGFNGATAGGGICDRCDLYAQNYMCLWRCSLGPACATNIFHSGLDYSDLVGECAPMCTVPPGW